MVTLCPRVFLSAGHPVLRHGVLGGKCEDDNGEAVAQYNTAHKSTQDSGSEAGMTERAAVQRGAMAQTAHSAVTPCYDTGPWEASARMTMARR